MRTLRVASKERMPSRDKKVNSSNVSSLRRTPSARSIGKATSASIKRTVPNEPPSLLRSTPQTIHSPITSTSNWMDSPLDGLTCTPDVTNDVFHFLETKARSLQNPRRDSTFAVYDKENQNSRASGSLLAYDTRLQDSTSAGKSPVERISNSSFTQTSATERINDLSFSRFMSSIDQSVGRNISPSPLMSSINQSELGTQAPNQGVSKVRPYNDYDNSAQENEHFLEPQIEDRLECQADKRAADKMHSSPAPDVSKIKKVSTTTRINSLKSSSGMRTVGKTGTTVKQRNLSRDRACYTTPVRPTQPASVVAKPTTVAAKDDFDCKKEISSVSQPGGILEAVQKYVKYMMLWLLGILTVCAMFYCIGTTGLPKIFKMIVKVIKKHHSILQFSQAQNGQCQNTINADMGTLNADHYETQTFLIV